MNLIQLVGPYRGKKLNDCIDTIESVADTMGYSVNVMDPEFNLGPIDNDPRRLNVRTDGGIIKSFTIG